MKKSTQEIIGFNDRWFVLLGIPILAVLIPLLFFNPTPSLDLSLKDYFLTKFPVSLTYCTIFWPGGRATIIAFRRRVDLEGRETLRVALEIGVITCLVVITNLFLGQFLAYCGLPKDQLSFRTAMVTSLTITYLVVFIYESIYFYQKWRETLVEKERFKQAALESQLEGLKAHINPHFLFNSLNTLSYTIKEDPDRAVSLVQKLAKVYRFILEVRNREVITLEEEMHNLQNYLFLLKERFEENLQLEIDIPENTLQRGVPPMAIQMLVENAIKHNIVSTQSPLGVQIQVVNDRIAVKNNLQRKNQPGSSTGFGLENIKTRYKFFTEEEVQVIVTQQSFVVTLPLLQLPKQETVARV